MSLLIVKEQVFGYEVEYREIKRPGNKPFIPIRNTGKGVLHTTEGTGIEAAFDTLDAHHSAPHFLVGEERIIQCRPLGVQSAALVDPGNRLAYVQIENCGFTGGSPDYSRHAMDAWQFADSTFKPLAALMAYLAKQDIIPLRRAYAWPDDCSDMRGIWARVNNTRRIQMVYNDIAAKGWFYHLEVPFNSHYDCGALHFSELLNAAQTLLSQVSEETSDQEQENPSEQPVHIVEPGESFYSIARQYDVMPEALSKANGLTLESVLHPGQLLTIPAGDS